MIHINQSWREQRKAIIAHSNDHTEEYISLWQASHHVAEQEGCKPDTAKKEIRKAIRNGSLRYGMKWQWKE